MSKPSRPTKTQALALELLSKGGAFRSTRAFSDNRVYTPEGSIAPATVSVLVRNGWAKWGPEVSLKKPLDLTDAGRAFLPAQA
ncbi:hypothetical protein [Streptomyces sp. MMBL 11-1]|uniref:hypothetical protein n=1 Tax=Streptomyces sp. MMBL 11-1 TaxID=3026420 RepID=UPI00235F3850|nr:hypothetical protein [Streptomyces sp. MMBL 11-1]